MSFLENKAFEIITGRLTPILSAKGFSASKPESGKNGSLSLTYKGSDRAFRVSWDAAGQKYRLLRTAVDGDTVDDDWSEMSLWLFDPDTHDETDAKTIANDFEDTISDLYKKAVKVERRSDIRKNKATDIKGLVKKFVVLYPQYESELESHLSYYGELLPDTFIDKSMGSFMYELLRQKKTPQLKKWFDFLGDTYEKCDVQVRSAITVTLFRTLLLHPDLNELAKTYMTDGLKKAWIQMEKVLSKQGDKLPG